MGRTPRYDETSSRTACGTRVVEGLGTDEVYADRTTAYDSALIHREAPVTKESWQAPTRHEVPVVVVVMPTRRRLGDRDDGLGDPTS
jgi:hypothetical protein